MDYKALFADLWTDHVQVVNVAYEWMDWIIVLNWIIVTMTNVMNELNRRLLERKVYFHFRKLSTTAIIKLTIVDRKSHYSWWWSFCETMTNNLPQYTGYMRNLAAMWSVRGIRIRCDPLIDRRSVNREAVLGQFVGTSRDGPQTCDHCRNGVRPFVGCVVVERKFKGRCAYCHQGSEGSRHSFRDRKYVLYFKRIWWHSLLMKVTEATDCSSIRALQSITGLIIGIFGFGFSPSDAGCRQNHVPSNSNSPRSANEKSSQDLVAITDDELQRD